MTTIEFIEDNTGELAQQALKDGYQAVEVAIGEGGVKTLVEAHNKAQRRIRELEALVEAYRRDSEALGQQLENAIDAAIAAEARADAAHNAKRTAEDEQLATAAELDEANAQIEAMRKALEMVEWELDGESYFQCPWCETRQWKGHKPDCARQAALATTPAEPPPMLPTPAMLDAKRAVDEYGHKSFKSK